MQRYDNIIMDANNSKTCCQLYLYDDVLLFYPILPAIAKKLTISEKSLELNTITYLREVRYRKRELFNRVSRQKGIVGVTYQGFLQKVINACVTSGATFALKDMRVARKAASFPAPRLDLMHGFRFSQESLITEALEKDMSGLIGAPTRYGKTTLMVNTLRAFPNLRAVVAAPGVDLCNQLYDDITGDRGIKNREVKLLCSGSRHKQQSQEPNGVTICSVDSLFKCDGTDTELLLADEPHEFVTDKRLDMLSEFTKARRYGYGATLTGRFDNRDIIIEGVFGPVLAERTYVQAVQEGAICPINVLFLDIEIEPKNYRDRDAAYKGLLFRNRGMANIAKKICHEVIPNDYQTLLFIKEEKQADLYLDIIGHEATVAMAKKMNKSQREEITEKMRNGKIKRCLCTDIYVQGVTFPDSKVLVNLEGGGNNTSAIQKPGRLAQIRPGKKCGILIDFNFTFPGIMEDYKGEAWTALVADSKAREKAYTDKGYGIYHVNTLDKLKSLFDSLTK